MNIRLAKEKDIEKIMDLLSQVLEVHAALRPDYFVKKTTKYTREEIFSMFSDDTRRIYVAADEKDEVLGYAFCEIKQQPNHANLVPFRSIYIDDLCVDEKHRGKHIAHAIFDHVKKEAADLGCYEISLTVWEGNDTARRFYDLVGFRPKSTTMEFILK